MSAEGFQDFLIKLARNFKPVQVKNNLSIQNLNLTIEIGDKEYKIQNGHLIIGEGAEGRVPLVKDNEGFVRPLIEGVEVEGISDKKAENVKMLDVEEKVFTRSDIGETQIHLLDIEREQENILKELKPILESHRNGVDLGALLSAINIIKIEDAREDHELYIKLHDQFIACYKKRGSMIYNLMRSRILQTEVLIHLRKLKVAYPNFEDAKLHFLIYWDSILEIGYLTAYFVKEEDSEQSLSDEIKWRLDKGVSRLYVYSRRSRRNKYAEKWCRNIAKKEGWHCNKIKEYILGFTPAVKFRIQIR